MVGDDRSPVLLTLAYITAFIFWLFLGSTITWVHFSLSFPFDTIPFSGSSVSLTVLVSECLFFETSRSFQVVSVAKRMGRVVQNVFRWTPQFSDTSLSFSSFIRRSAPLIASLTMELIE